MASLTLALALHCLFFDDLGLNIAVLGLGDRFIAGQSKVVQI